MTHCAFSCPVFTAWHSTEGNSTFLWWYISLAGHLHYSCDIHIQSVHNSIACAWQMKMWFIPVLTLNEKIFNSKVKGPGNQRKNLFHGPSQCTGSAAKCCESPGLQDPHCQPAKWFQSPMYQTLVPGAQLCYQCCPHFIGMLTNKNTT